MTRNLCSSGNKINSLGKPTNRWKNLYVDTIVLGDGNRDSNLKVITDIGKEHNPFIQYNVLENKWQISHRDNIVGNVQTIYHGEEEPHESIGAIGDIYLAYGDIEIDDVPEDEPEEPELPTSIETQWIKVEFFMSYYATDGVTDDESPISNIFITDKSEITLLGESCAKQDLAIFLPGLYKINY